MSKNIFFTGQPVLTQLIDFIPRNLVEKCTKKNQSDYYCKTFKSYNHLITMLFASYHQCNGLRELTTGMQAWQDRLQHIGIMQYPRKSTLSDANSRRTHKFFEDIYYSLFRLHRNKFSPDSRPGRLENRLYVMDSSTFDLFADVMQGVGAIKENGKRKGGVKAHMMIDYIHQLPAICYFSEARENDRILMDKIHLPSGSILVFDKGYVKHSQWQRWTEKNIIWTTRMNENASYELIQEMPISDSQRAKGVLSDQMVLLGRGTGPTTEIIPARRIGYFDKKKKRQFTFLTNSERLSPATIAGFYKKRWKIENYFKSLKQNFQLRYFLGDSPNAILIQLWCALIADMLIKLVMTFARKKRWAYANLRALIRMHLGTYVNLMAFLNSPEKALRSRIKYMTGQLKFNFNPT